MTTNASDAEVAAQARIALAEAMVGGKPLPENPKIPDASSNANTSGTGASGTGSSGAQGDSGSSSQDNPDDPFSKAKLEDLISHPVLGPQLQRRIDTQVANQTKTWQERKLPELQREVETRAIQEYLDSLSPEERGEVLAKDPDLAVTWGQLQNSRKNQPIDQQLVEDTSRIYAYSSRLRAGDTLLNEAGLKPEGELDPKFWSDQISTGKLDSDTAMSNWEAAVQAAIINDKVAKALDEKWEAYRLEKEAKQPQRANLAGTRPGASAAPTPQVLETKTSDLWEAAFAKDRK